MSRPFSISTRNSIPITLVLLAFLIALLLIVWIVVTPLRDWQGPYIGYRAFRATPLATVIDDLERHDLIPVGTTWESPDLKTLPVTLRWLWATQYDALHDLARAARVEIVYPAGYHGDVVGPIRIQHLTSGEGSARPLHRGRTS